MRFIGFCLLFIVLLIGKNIFSLKTLDSEKAHFLRSLEAAESAADLTSKSPDDLLCLNLSTLTGEAVLDSRNVSDNFLNLIGKNFRNDYRQMISGLDMISQGYSSRNIERIKTGIEIFAEHRSRILYLLNTSSQNHFFVLSRIPGM